MLPGNSDKKHGDRVSTIFSIFTVLRSNERVPRSYFFPPWLLSLKFDSRTFFNPRKSYVVPKPFVTDLTIKRMPRHYVALSWLSTLDLVRLYGDVHIRMRMYVLHPNMRKSHLGARPNHVTPHLHFLPTLK